MVSYGSRRVIDGVRKVLVSVRNMSDGVREASYGVKSIVFREVSEVCHIVGKKVAGRCHMVTIGCRRVLDSNNNVSEGLRMVQEICQMVPGRCQERVK